MIISLLAEYFGGFKRSIINTPDEAINALVVGNDRFCKGLIHRGNKTAKYARRNIQNLKPFAAIITCSDSRVPVELLFDQGFGDIFVIRTAGNTVMDNETKASVDYAVNYLGVKLVMVLGHTNCGAITGVVTAGLNSSDDDDKEVSELFDRIAEGIPHHKGSGLDNLDCAIVDNVKWQAAKLLERPNISKRVENNDIAVVTSIYDVTTGKVIVIPEL